MAKSTRMMQFFMLVLAISPAAADHPIAGVISLLNKLMVQSKEEAATEQATYQKFTYWCKTSTKTLKKAIKKEDHKISKYTDEIAGLKKEISTLTEDIETLTKQIETQEAHGARADELRQNETEFYVKTYKNLDDTIVAVDDAVEVMEKTSVKALFIGLNHKVKRASLLHEKQPEQENEVAEAEAELASIASSGELRARSRAGQDKLAKSVTALNAATKKLKKGAALEATSVEKKSAQLPDEFAHINLNPGAKNPFKKGKVKVFTEHEGEVIETFRDIEGDLEFDKLDVHRREANAQNAYELAKKARDHSIDAAKDNKKEKEDIKADKGAELAKVEADLESEKNERVGDAATLDSTDQQCKDTAASFKQRSDIRGGEIEAMEMAVKILSKVTGVRNPDEHEIPKKALAQKSLADSVAYVVEDKSLLTKSVSFLQMPANNTKEKAVALLREAATKAHNGALQRLAQELQAFSGPFDKMKAMIQKMIFRLQAEQKDEDDHKNWCDLELQRNEDTKEDKDEKIKLLNIKIEEYDSSIKLLAKSIKENEEKIADITTYMEEETELREENKAEIQLTIKDSVAAQEAVAQAITVLKDFYKESGMIAKEPWEFVQVSSSGRSGGIKLPDSPSTWDASYTGVTDPQSGADGVLGILEGVATKFSAMEADAKMADVTDQKAYDKDMAARKIEIAGTKQDVNMKTQKQTGLQSKLDSAAATLKATTKEHDAVAQYLKDLVPACAPGEGSYEDRKQARSDEITALRKAQNVLEDAFRAKA